MKSKTHPPARMAQQPTAAPATPVHAGAGPGGPLSDRAGLAGAAASHGAALLQLQRTHGNHFVARQLERQGRPVQRQSVPGPAAASYEPELVSDSPITFALLNQEIDHPVQVRNAGQAPPGADFAWEWSELDTARFEALSTVPPAGPRATLRARTRTAFQNAT